MPYPNLAPQPQSEPEFEAHLEAWESQHELTSELFHYQLADTVTLPDGTIVQLDASSISKLEELLGNPDLHRSELERYLEIINLWLNLEQLSLEVEKALLDAQQLITGRLEGKLDGVVVPMVLLNPRLNPKLALIFAALLLMFPLAINQFDQPELRPSPYSAETLANLFQGNLLNLARELNVIAGLQNIPTADLQSVTAEYLEIMNLAEQAQLSYPQIRVYLLDALGADGLSPQTLQYRLDIISEGLAARADATSTELERALAAQNSPEIASELQRQLILEVLELNEFQSNLFSEHEVAPELGIDWTSPVSEESYQNVLRLGREG